MYCPIGLEHYAGSLFVSKKRKRKESLRRRRAALFFAQKAREKKLLEKSALKVKVPRALPLDPTKGFALGSHQGDNPPGPVKIEIEIMHFRAGKVKRIPHTPRRFSRFHKVVRDMPNALAAATLLPPAACRACWITVRSSTARDGR